MVEPMHPIEIVRRRLHAQRLTGEPFATAAQAVAYLGAVQAQEHAEALWALGARVRDHDEAAVAAACDRGEILRTHVLRPTWHFVAAADLRWLLRLTGPRVLAKDAGRMRQLGLDAGTLARVHELLLATLSDGEPRTRAELASALDAAGVDTSGQRIAHAVMHAELSGVLCGGPRRGAHHTYLPLDGRVPRAPERDRDADVAELVLRYFSSHGPATPRDFAWWSGLTIADAQAGLAAAGERLVAEPDDHGTQWISLADRAADPPHRGALLLGTYDETLVAYRDLRNVGPDG
ncbi:MAG: hypothetical protein QOG94_464, partial [Solirubrobacteraceae bacterium]|nr:hypothetical protein [Solirubrobacteraceae bacterium]